MYAIRSYYGLRPGTTSRWEAVAVGACFCLQARRPVITSYSIHYTKLYDLSQYTDPEERVARTREQLTVTTGGGYSSGISGNIKGIPVTREDGQPVYAPDMDVRFGSKPEDP